MNWRLEIESAEPEWGDDGVPHCTEDCVQHDGKRCMIFGQRPGVLCEPAVAQMASLLDLRRK